MTLRVALVMLSVLVLPAASFAQGGPATAPRFWLDLNVGGSSSAAPATTFTYEFIIFAEDASMSATYPKPPAGRVLDFGAGYLFTPRIGAGVSVAGTSRSDVVELAATIPHPIFFNAHASTTGETAQALHRKETAVHVHVMAVAVESDALQVRVFGGPSFIGLKADLVRDMAINQVAGGTPQQNTLTITGSTWEQTTGRATGFHAGADVAYFFSPNVGVGGGLRISRGTVTLDREPMSEVSQDLKVGGTEVFVGLRFKFSK